MKLDWKNLFATVIVGLALLFPGAWLNEVLKDQAIVAYDLALEQVLDRAKTPNFTLLDPSDQKISGNVYSAKLGIWNAGTTNVPATAVRVPIALSCGPASRIIDILQLQHPVNKYGDFKTSRVNESTFKIEWRELDPGMGVQVRALLESPQSPECKIDGAFFPARLESQADRMSSSNKLVIYASPALSLCMPLGVIIFSRVIRPRLRQTDQRAIDLVYMPFFSIIFMFIIVFLGFLIWYIIKPTDIPF